MNETHLRSILWAVDRIMEASDDDISESGEICDSVAEEGAPVFTQGGRCRAERPCASESAQEGAPGGIH